MLRARGPAGPVICNLYSLTKGQQAIRELARAMRDNTGNLPPQPAIFPDYAAPIVRTTDDGVRELGLARWGMPSPALALEGRKTDPGVTNIRNTKRALAALACNLTPMSRPLHLLLREHTRRRRQVSAGLVRAFG